MDCSPPGSSVHGDPPGKNTGVGCHALLQGILSTQWSNLHPLCLLHWQAGSLLLAPLLLLYSQINLLQIPKRPNRKIDVFLQTNKTYSQVHDVASEGDGLDFNLYFHPRANLLNSLGPVWPWVNFLTSMIILNILGRWMPMRKASGLSFVLQKCPEVMYLLWFLCGQESSVLKTYLSISQSPVPLHSVPPKGPHPPADSPPWGCASSAPLCADS